MGNLNGKEYMTDVTKIDYVRLNDDIFNDRVEYYLGNVNKTMYLKLFERNPKIHLVDSNILHFDLNSVPEAIRQYFVEMQNYYKLYKQYAKGDPDPKFLFFPGDVNHHSSLPVLAKTRPVGNIGMGLNVLLPLNIRRHWVPINEVEMSDIPFQNKRERVVWRGLGTGMFKRTPLVEQFYKNETINGNETVNGIEIDIGFTGFQKNYPGRRNKILIKDALTIPEMLKNKYLISVEGNDVASNLKWILSSQSVCIKPPAKTVSWLMEDRLVPWVHYVPVRHDFADLRQKLEWCRRHPRKCMEIIKAANDYMNRFKSGDEKLIVDVLKGYTDNVRMI